MEFLRSLISRRTWSSKRRKTEDDLESAENTTCRINELPDFILHHLLSFLTTKQAVATSILSKRWRYLWIEVPALDFEDSPSCKTDRNHKKAFKKFVYRVLLLNRQVTLHKFRLKCHNNVRQYSGLQTWIDDVIIRRNVVGEVDISISGYTISIPPFFKPTDSIRYPTIKNLKVLKLSRGFQIDDCTPISFPSLKILHLNFLYFTNGGDSVSSLLRGCSVLEELHIKRGSYDNVPNFSISVPTLKILSYIGHQHCREFIDRFYSYQLRVNTPALEYLNIEDVGGTVLLYLESNFVRLIQANITFNGIGLLNVFKALFNAKFLSFKWTSSLYNYELGESLKCDSFPSFVNLTQLELISCRTRDFHDLDVLRQFLENSHHLKVLILNMVSFD
ncbi:hypothetical protein COLO4_09416 [Corchorus olitorius]|uniref:F-box domain-containing protein n=1 Tax=Corchorus olitorius TaxID=93759 RepID=A0A1R3KC49_9ROSI|nr:hypothetical protein COLO4_09416 [Corchorus olitorius]